MAWMLDDPENDPYDTGSCFGVPSAAERLSSHLCMCVQVCARACMDVQMLVDSLHWIYTALFSSYCNFGLDCN